MGKKVAIIGAGPAGVVAAIALKRQGFEPTLYDKVDPIEVLKETLRTGEPGVIQFGETGGTVSLYGNGLRALKNLGLLDKVEELRRVQNDSMVFALQDGSDRVVRNLHTTKPGEIEPMYVLRSEFHALLMRESNFLGVKTFAGKKFASLEETADSQVIVTFTDGTIVEADFVIGADGVYSGVRRFIFPEAPLPTIYGCGYVGIVDLGPHPSGINVKFDDMMAIHMDPIGGHAMYNSTYSPTGGAFNIIDWNKPEGVTSDDADWKPYLDLPKETSKLADVLEGWGMKQNLVDVVRTAKRLAPLSLVDLPDLPVFYKGRVVLIGDAAHGTLPTMGQGLNLALEDAATLGDLFGHFEEEGDVGKVFALYDKIRKPHVQKVAENSRVIAGRMRAENKVQMRIGRFVMRLIFTIQNLFRLNDAILYHDYRKSLAEEVPEIHFK